MRLVEKILPAFFAVGVLTFAAPWQAAAQESASASVKPAGPSKTERPPSMNQSAPQKKQEEEGGSFAQSKPQPPCKVPNCKNKNPTPSKYRD